MDNFSKEHIWVHGCSSRQYMSKLPVFSIRLSWTIFNQQKVTFQDASQSQGALAMPLPGYGDDRTQEEARYKKQVVMAKTFGKRVSPLSVVFSNSHDKKYRFVPGRRVRAQIMTIPCIIFNHVRQSIHPNSIVRPTASGMQWGANPNHASGANRIRGTYSGYCCGS